MMYRLPDALRASLQKPWGRIAESEELRREKEEITRRHNYIITVGDIATITFIKLGFDVNIGVVDYRTRRGEVSTEYIKELSDFGKKRIEVKNPPGYITEELLTALGEAINLIGRSSVLIVVDGEEDLAALPLFRDSPVSTIVAYGMPKNGVVLVDVDDNLKKRAEEILDMMKIEQKL